MSRVDATRPPVVVLGVMGLWAMGLWGAAFVAASGAPPSRTALVLCASFAPYAWLVHRASLSTKAVLLLAVAGGLALVVAPSVLSDDLYRYLWDARVAAAGIDPYRYAPDDPALVELRDALWWRVNHPQIPTIYPPIAQGLFGVAEKLAHAPWSIKALAFSAHLGAIPAVSSLAKASGRVAPSRAALAWGLNPLAISESALGGHVDVFVGLALVLFGLNLLRERPFYAAWSLVAATGLKLVGLLLVPVLAAKHARAALLALAIGLVALVPLAGAGGDRAVGGLGQYARRWSGNAGGYALVEGAVGVALESAFGIRPGRVRVGALASAFAFAEGTALDPRRSFMPEKKPIPDLATFDTHVLASFLARGLILLGLLGLAGFMVRRRVEPLMAARLLLLAGLFFAPQVHPWYLLWILPLECAVGGTAVWVWSATALIAYAPLDGWWSARVWEEPRFAASIQYGLVAILLFWEWVGNDRGRPA